MYLRTVTVAYVSVFILLCITAQSAWAVDFHFSWLPNSEPDVSGYRMYYGLQSRDYSGYVEVNAVPDPDTGLMHGTMSGLDEQVVYFFAVTAFTGDNVESDFSSEITASIQPANNTVDFHFSWLPNSEPDVSGYRIYYGLQSRDYSDYVEVDAVPDQNTGLMHGTISGLDQQAVYFFAVTAFTGDNVESDYSSEITAFTQPADIIMTSPVDGSVYVEGETISFSGSAVDLYGDDLSSSIQWRSDLDGIIGTGPSLQSSTLSIGTHNITAAVTDSNGLVQEESILLAIDEFTDQIDELTNQVDFNTVSVSNYSTSQTNSGTVAVEDNGATLAITGNRWLSTEQLYTITPETVIEFDFLSSSEGEIQGIGFDDDNDIYNNQRVFQIFGTHIWNDAIQVEPKYSTTDTGNWVHFSIAVGQFYTGNNMHMVFVNDDDRIPSTGTGRYRNIRVYSAATKILGDTLNADLPGTVSETFINLNDVNNEGADHISTWSWSSPGPHKIANTIILKADLSDIPPNVYISEAMLYLYQTKAIGAAEYKNSIHKITGVNPIIDQVSGYDAQDNTPWKQVPTDTTHNDIPLGLEDIDVAEDTVILDATPGYRSWSITDMVRNWVGNPETNFGLLIQGESTQVETGRTFASSENQDAAIRPFIVIRYSVGM